MPISRYGHVVVLPTALEVIPSRAHKAQFSGLAVDDILQLNLETGVSLLPIIERKGLEALCVADLPLALWGCHHLNFLRSSSSVHAVT